MRLIFNSDVLYQSQLITGELRAVCRGFFTSVASLASLLLFHQLRSLNLVSIKLSLYSGRSQVSKAHMLTLINTESRMIGWNHPKP